LLLLLLVQHRVLFHSGDNILTAVSVARQCGLVPAEDKLVFVNAYSPDGGAPARIEWVCHEDSARRLDTTTTSPAPDEVLYLQSLRVCGYPKFNTAQ